MAESKSFERHFQDWVKAKSEVMYTAVTSSTESPIEAIAYLHLLEWSSYMSKRYTAPSVRTQVPIQCFRVDFLVELNERKVIVECDGHEFHERTAQQATRDKRRDRIFAKLGYFVLRYTGSEVCRNPEQILIDVQQILFGGERVSV